MSPKKQVPNLQCVSLNFITNQLMVNLSDDEGSYYGAVLEYLSSATSEIVQSLLTNVLRSEYLDASTRYSCLEVLLRSDVKKLDIGIFPHSYYEGILRVITGRGTGLHYLNLKGVWARDHPHLLSELIRSLKNLKVLIVPHMPDDSVMETISQLEKLSILDISGECAFTLHGLELLKNETITVLELGSFGKPNICQNEKNDCEILANVIENLPNLHYLRVYSFVGAAFSLLQKKYPNFKTKLKYIRDTGTTVNHIDAIINLCPNLENIYLDSPEMGVINKLGVLKKLNSLKLIKPAIEEVEVYLNEAGSRVQTLKLNRNRFSSLDLSDICLNAPNLQTLECFQMHVIFSQTDTFFMSLQNIEILYCDIADSSLKYILLNAPFLNRIAVGCAINMTDGDIFRLCAESDFICLQEIWFSCARSLTSTSVELLMGHCPNLKVIGQLNGWDVTTDDYDYLKTVITYTNTDLSLVYS